jgi:3-oxoacyl-[acyl-carrier protein] reductase
MNPSFFIGQFHQSRLLVDSALVDSFAAMSGDKNPVHMDAGQARRMGYSRPVAHGAILIAELSRVIGMDFPGPGSIWIRQELEWVRPMLVGDEIVLKLEVQSFSMAAMVVELLVTAVNQRGEQVLTGKGAVKVPETLEIARSSGEPDPKRVVVVTGGGGGIGSAVAKRLGSAGWNVVVTYLRNEAAARDIVREIRACGGEATAFGVDVNDSKEVHALIERTFALYGRVDAVVHAATPVLSRASVGKFSFADCEPYLRTYFGGFLSLINASNGQMRDRRYGRFVLLGTAAMIGSPPQGFGPYLAGKGAAVELARAAAFELGPFGITVNVVSPGLTVTDLTVDVPARAKEIEARRSPMRRLATPDDSAALIEFLLSDSAGYINGAHLPVTGGA